MTTRQVFPQNASCDMEEVEKNDRDSLENNEENLIDVESEGEQVESTDNELGKCLIEAT